MPVPGLSPELFPQGALPCSLCHFRGHWPVWSCLGTMLCLPKAPERRLQPCPRLGHFLCKSKNKPLYKATGLMLSQSQSPATSASCVLFIGILTSSGPPVWACQTWDQSPAINHWTSSLGGHHRWPYWLLPLKQTYTGLLLHLSALVSAHGRGGHRVPILSLHLQAQGSDIVNCPSVVSSLALSQGLRHVSSLCSLSGHPPLHTCEDL